MQISRTIASRIVSGSNNTLSPKSLAELPHGLKGINAALNGLVNAADGIHINHMLDNLGNHLCDNNGNRFKLQ
jgi:hypothetical protein